MARPSPRKRNSRNSLRGDKNTTSGSEEAHDSATMGTDVESRWHSEVKQSRADTSTICSQQQNRLSTAKSHNLNQGIGETEFKARENHGHRPVLCRHKKDDIPPQRILWQEGRQNCDLGCETLESSNFQEPHIEVKSSEKNQASKQTNNSL